MPPDEITLTFGSESKDYYTGAFWLKKSHSREVQALMHDNISRLVSMQISSSPSFDLTGEREVEQMHMSHVSSRHYSISLVTHHSMASKNKEHALWLVIAFP